MPVKKPADTANFSCNGCGDCCEEFFLPLSPQELLDAFRYDKDQDNKIRMSVRLSHDLRKGGMSMNRRYQDIDLVAPMVRLVREEKNDDGDPRYIYRCVHFDSATRKCGIYTIRPRMCKGFPFYGSKVPCFDTEMYPRCKYRALIPKDKPEESVECCTVKTQKKGRAKK